jgi:hypothetical protein
MLLWYDRPATEWVEALPLGNGRLGAMVYGGAAEDLIRLNDDTLYSGEPGQRDLPLDVTRTLIRSPPGCARGSTRRRSSSRRRTGVDAPRRATSRSATCISFSATIRSRTTGGSWI